MVPHPQEKQDQEIMVGVSENGGIPPNRRLDMSEFENTQKNHGPWIFWGLPHPPREQGSPECSLLRLGTREARHDFFVSDYQTMDSPTINLYKSNNETTSSPT